MTTICGGSHGLGADEIQLFYQMALQDATEMHLAPDEYAGFTMALMRMAAFAPTDAPPRSALTPRSSSSTSSTGTSAATVARSEIATGDSRSGCRGF